MDDDQKLDALADIFQALSDRNRLRILSLLRFSSHPICVNRIAATIGISQSAVSQHLKILRNNGLVRMKKEGYFKRYSLNDMGFRTIRELRSSVLGEDYEI